MASGFVGTPVLPCEFYPRRCVLLGTDGAGPQMIRMQASDFGLDVVAICRSCL